MHSNLQALSTAVQLGGEIKYLSAGEIAGRNQAAYGPYSVATWRAWEYWATKCGCQHMISRPEPAEPKP